MSILLQQKNVGDYSYMSSPNIYYRALFYSVLYFDCISLHACIQSHLLVALQHM